MRPKSPKAKPDPDSPGQFLANGKSQKAGLNRSIHDAAPAMLIAMLKTKVAEAASELLIANTRDRTLDAVSLVDEPRMLPPGSYVQVDESERVVTDDPHLDGQGATSTRPSSRRAQTPPDSLKKPRKQSKRRKRP